MSRIFADACYWIALLHRNDQLHAVALANQNQLKRAHIVTTDEVLTELLNFISARAPGLRTSAAQIVEKIRGDKRVTVVEQSRATFDGGLARYKRDADKTYSLVDCVSFELMMREGITEALTDDHDFERAGFVAMLRARDS